MAGFTVGAGLTIWGQEIAYAWVPYGDLGDTQYFSLVLRFGQSAEDKKKNLQARDTRSYRTANRSGDDPEAAGLTNMLSNDEGRTAQKAIQ